MDAKYTQLWEMAKPYYEKGRIYDVPHIEWMVKESEKLLESENFDPEILLPVSILHDIGYCKVKNNTNPNVKDQDSKKLHMAEGAKIALELLNNAGFSEDKATLISHLISVHDNWVFGDSSIFKEVPEMAAFNDLDYIYPFNNIGQFKINAESMGLNPSEAFDRWMDDEKLTNRPFCCKYTKDLYERLIANIKAELEKA